MFCDPQGRVFRYLRLSLTKACQMRCMYCRAPGLPGVPDADEESTAIGPGAAEPSLTAEEIGGLVSHLADRHGLCKVRLTGGDPAMRPDLVAIIARLAAIRGIEDLAMTTNGLTLAEAAGRYAAAGLRRVNISLDSLDRRRFHWITGHDLLGQTLAGIDAAVAAGLSPVKLNTVVIRGENDDEVADLVAFAANRGVEIRFIELMPLGPQRGAWARRFVPADEVRQRLDCLVDAWLPAARMPAAQIGEPALRYRVRLRNGQIATVGFIAPMSRPFCVACNRLRIAADGSLMACLMDEPAGAASVLPALRPRLNPGRLDEIFAAAVARKPAQHADAARLSLSNSGRGDMVRIGG